MARDEKSCYASGWCLVNRFSHRGLVMNNSDAAGTTPPRRKKWRVVGLLLAVVFAVAGALLVWSWRSHDPGRTFQQARADLRDGNLDRLPPAIASLEQFPSYRPHAHYLRGMLLLRQGRLIESLNEFSYSADHPELEADTLVSAGQALYQAGRIGEAHRFWTKALQSNPGSVNAHRWLGVLYYDLGAMDQAIVHLKEASHLAPDDPRPDRLLGLIYKDYERYSEAVPHYQESLRRSANQADQEQIRLELAESQVKLSAYQDALKSLEACPDSPRKLALEAECYFGLGDLERASQLTQSALEKSPILAEALLLQGRIHLAQGDAPAAIEVLSQGARMHPHDYAIHYNLSQAYSRAGDQANAATYAARAEALKKLWEEFADLHLQAISRPSDIDVRFRLGETASQLGRKDLAVNWYRAVLGLDPNHEAAAKALAQLQTAGDSARPPQTPLSPPLPAETQSSEPGPSQG
jgi:tetratricopeptide (TPR) repeat protein